MRVITVCGMGFGTSLMLLMTIKDIGKKHHVAVEGEAVDLGSYKGKPCDLIAASSGPMCRFCRLPIYLTKRGSKK